MRKTFLLLFAFSTLLIKAQQKITFGYDNAGNQINRVLCVNCSAKTAVANEEVLFSETEIFSRDDLFSYYPNPVREELYLSWNTLNDKKINLISVYSILGQQVAVYDVSKINSLSISFQNFPSGVYLVLADFSNGEEQTIKIIKQ
ncbi:T9SS type A sorting domain-containing protein [Flavobacterium anhuiense]|uniref:T9SS type A sorting domain-containing protein n=1 Tax=Flavobacterium anhuiense TaxID=459526 RepID=UPI000E6CAB25|nr:T9SS type A sorting domain-containing protein [Flavobacterium anhuiense]